LRRPVLSVFPGSPERIAQGFDSLIPQDAARRNERPARRSVSDDEGEFGPTPEVVERSDDLDVSTLRITATPCSWAAVLQFNA
jgi:hypothetical protein